ncbi:hypothetical protein ACIBG7_27190 [Nonomuraea sp. NPDC050328]|uniref:hypothetical protein n=1 Tax=Nonomuraea sp. NPDC050328 TaxID=3364361 RepID=UPI0037BA3E36
MNDRQQPGHPPPTSGVVGDTSSLGQACSSIDELISLTITTARHTHYAAAAEAVIALQNGRFLGGEQLFTAVYAQTTRAWWDLVDGEITHKKLTCEHAVVRVRSWARHFLTKEAPAARPGTLFEHALAHAARMAARDFLATSSQLLIHRKVQSGGGTDAPAPGTPCARDTPDSSPATPPTPGVPSSTANTP